MQANSRRWLGNLFSKSSPSDSRDMVEEKETKKRGKRKRQVSMSLGEIKEVLKELKEVKREAIRRKVFCSQCKVEKYLTEECTTSPSCAICMMIEFL